MRHGHIWLVTVIWNRIFRNVFNLFMHNVYLLQSNYYCEQRFPVWASANAPTHLIWEHMEGLRSKSGVNPLRFALGTVV